MIIDNSMSYYLLSEKYVRTERRTSSSRCKSMRSLSMKPKVDEESTKRGLTSASNTVVTRSSLVDSSIVPITAYYDPHGHLTEIAITVCSFPLHRKVIQAINVCVPFHSFLTKLVIRKGCLDYLLVYEVGKLLPHSNLTDVCLDDSYVPEGNYYVLLDQASDIRYLSLNRCKINDAVCKEIASRLDFERPAEKSLMVLDLGSNKITDVGAKYFGEVLRRNRHLLHLNFQGNRISDTGLGFILKSLCEFPLTSDEIIDKKRRKYEYLRRKNEVYEHCLEEVTRMQKPEKSLHSYSLHGSRHAKFKKTKKSMSNLVEESLAGMAEKMTLELLGPLNDPFDDDCCIIKDNYIYSTGNLKLCSLNVAYNNIEFPSLPRILEVLKYQFRLEKNPSRTGLVRLVLAGNYLPDFCSELDSIQMYLKDARASQIAMGALTGHPKRKTSHKHKA